MRKWLCVSQYWRAIRPKPVIVDLSDKVLEDLSKGSKFSEYLAIGMLFATNLIQYSDQQFAGQVVIFLAVHWVYSILPKNYRVILVKWKQEKARCGAEGKGLRFRPAANWASFVSVLGFGPWAVALWAAAASIHPTARRPGRIPA
jgi:hypothetical protein